MRPLGEQLNDELERVRATGWQNARASVSDPTVDRLVSVARRLRATAELRVDPTFARHLEQHLYSRQAALQRARQQATWWSWRLPGGWRAHPWLSAATALCFVLLLSVGVLAAARGVDNPRSPLYGISVWEQEVQVSLAGSPSSQAELHLQFAQDRLDALRELAEGGQDTAYQQTLSEFDQQLTLASQQISSVPPGPDQDRLTKELATLKSGAIATLHGFLLHLSLKEQFATTDELGRLGDAITQLASVEVTLPAHPNGQATITIQGTGLQSGAQLLVDGKPKTATGSLKDNTLVFVVEQWTGTQHPQSIGIVNPDGTATQSTNVTVTAAPDNGNGNGGGNGSGNGNGNNGNNGNGNGKPDGTPTPPH